MSAGCSGATHLLLAACICCHSCRPAFWSHGVLQQGPGKPAGARACGGPFERGRRPPPPARQCTGACKGLTRFSSLGAALMPGTGSLSSRCVSCRQRGAEGRGRVAAAGGLGPIPGVHGPRMGPGVTLMILLGSWSTAMVKERLQQAAQGTTAPIKR